MNAVRADDEGDGKHADVPFSFKTDWPGCLVGCLVGSLGCWLATLAGRAVYPEIELANLVLVYLLCVMFVARHFGLGASALTSVLAVLALDYYFVPPVFSLVTARREDAITLLIMLGVALFVSGQTAQLRREAETARRSERRSATLYAFTSQLTEAQGTQEVASVAVLHLGNVFASQVAIFIADAEGVLRPCSVQGVPWWQDADLPTVQSVHDHRQPFEPVYPIGSGSPALYVPILAGAASYGVLALRPNGARAPSILAQRQFLDIFVGQIAQTLARIRLAHETEAAKLCVETESLRNSLLSTIAHDLRTPLASIVAASSSMLADRTLLSADDVEELTGTIHEEARRMARLLGKVLEMARLEAGVVKLQLDWYEMGEIIGSVHSRLGALLRGRELAVDLPEHMPMVQVDAVMLGQVLENLIENALKYTHPGSPIEVGAVMQKGELKLWVADRGPGIQAGHEARLFEKFYRGSDSGLRGGAGLGLTICRALIEAHGGRISAENRPGGGAIFTMLIPATQEPPSQPMDEADAE